MNDITVDISVIVPVYNGEKSIERCLNSLLCQTVSNYEIIVINNNSVDHTAAILDKYKSNKKIKIFNCKEKGVSNARNYGLLQVNSKYVAFVDADDFVEKNYLSALLSGFNKKEIDMVITGIKYLSPKLELTRKSTYRSGVFNNRQILSDILKYNGPGGFLWNKAFKVNLIKKYNITMDTSLVISEDLLFCTEYVLHTHFTNIVGTTYSYNYVDTEDSASSSMINEKKFILVYKNYLEVLNRIKDIIPKNYKRQMIDINARIGTGNCDFLELIYLYKTETISNFTKRKQYILLPFVLESSCISLKKKIDYILILLFSKKWIIIKKKLKI